MSTERGRFKNWRGGGDVCADIDAGPGYREQSGLAGLVQLTKSPSGPLSLMVANTCAQLTKCLNAVCGAGVGFCNNHVELSLIMDTATSAHWWCKHSSFPYQTPFAYEKQTNLSLLKPGGGYPTTISPTSDSLLIPDSTVRLAYRYNKVAGLRHSRDGTCGTDVTCTGSSYGSCCGADGMCGTSADSCGLGCQAGFGTGCWPISTNGRCAGTLNSICPNGASPCCSLYGYCGNGPDWCSVGKCQSAFGACASSVNECGPGNNYTCAGSAFGACCGPNGQVSAVYFRLIITGDS